MNQAILGRTGRPRDQAFPAVRQAELNRPAVARRVGACDQSALDQPGDDRRHAALMRMRSVGEIVQRLRRGLLELLQHEELRARQTDVFFGPS
jgi:hypothetical protein